MPLSLGPALCAVELFGVGPNERLAAVARHEDLRSRQQQEIRKVSLRYPKEVLKRLIVLKA